MEKTEGLKDGETEARTRQLGYGEVSTAQDKQDRTRVPGRGENAQDLLCHIANATLTP